MSSITLEQRPKYKLVQSGEKIIFVVKDSDTISNFKGKYIATIYVHNRVSGIQSQTPIIAKIIPNDTGVGILDLSPILDSFVSSENEGGIVHNQTSLTSAYNQTSFSQTTPHSIHQIDEFSTNRNTCRFFKIVFTCEFAITQTDDVIERTTGSFTTDEFIVYNGYLEENDILKLDANGNFGYNLDEAGFIMNDNESKFLTDSPTIQYIRDNDFMTFAFFSQYDEDFVVGGAGTTNPSVRKMERQFYYNGATTGSVITDTISTATGGHSGNMNDSNGKMQFFGVGTANLQGKGGSLPANWDYYTVKAFDDNNNQISKEYQIYRQTNDCKGFETIRLTWLNKYGSWDYYNFTKKSTRKLSKKPTTFNQLGGTWNESTYRFTGHLGGKKVLYNNITETITVNTDWITDDESLWLESLFTSSEVYIINEKSTDSAAGYIRKYVEPVIISTKGFTRKTKVNNKTFNYTFEIEKSKNRKTQRI